jgi:predicted ABC-type exoprotein transport system permease subunit
MTDFILLLATAAASVLFYGAWMKWNREGASQQMWLMIVTGLVILVNVVIWAAPDENGHSLLVEARK